MHITSAKVKMFNVLLTFFAFILFSCQTKTQENKENKNLSRLSGVEKITVGDELHIKYNPEGGPLEGKDDIVATTYCFNDYKWETSVIALKKDNDEWVADIALSNDCAFIAFLFVCQQNDGEAILDNNDDNGFAYTVLLNEKELAPGGNLAWGTFRSSSFTLSPSGYFNQFTVSDDALEYWTKKEVGDHTQNFPKFFEAYMATAKICAKEKYAQIVPNLIGQFLSDFKDQATENNYMTIENIYRYDLKEVNKADSIANVIGQKFPHGIKKRFEAFKRVYLDTRGNFKVAELEQFLQEFPLEEWKKDKDAASQKYMYDKLIQSLATKYFTDDSDDLFYALLDKAEFNVLADIYHWTVERTYKLKLKPIARIKDVSEVLIKQLNAKVNDQSYKPIFQSAPWNVDKHCRKALDEKLAWHIELINAVGDYDRARTYFDMISSSYKYAHTDLSEDYVNILKHTSSKEDRIDFLEKATKQNAISTLLLDELKSLYVESNNSAEGFEEYFEGLKDKEEQEKLKEELSNALINTPYEPFILSGSEGEVVDSKDFSGKIIILDFWATWCGPCKKVFPGMQLLVNKYAKDSSVELYFIDTQEFGDSFKVEAKKYLEDKNYKFNLLYDEKSPKSDTNDKVFLGFAKIFNSSGIPRKVVLKDGVIRYTSEGYSGSASLLVDEFSLVVDLLKAEK